MSVGLAALGTLAQGGTPDAAFSQAVGAAVLQQAAGALLPGLPNGISIAAGLQLLQQVSLGQPLCFMTDVDASSLVPTRAAASGSVSSGTGGLFEDGEEGLQAFLGQLEEAVEELF